MENYTITDSEEGHFTTPRIHFDAETGVCEIAGEAYMEDAMTFFMPSFDWLKKFSKEQKDKPLDMTIKLTYFNTSASKALYEIVCILKDFIDIGGNVKVQWHFDENEPEALEDIEDIMIETDVEIKMIPV